MYLDVDIVQNMKEPQRDIHRRANIYVDGIRHKWVLEVNTDDGYIVEMQTDLYDRAIVYGDDVMTRKVFGKVEFITPLLF